MIVLILTLFSSSFLGMMFSLFFGCVCTHISDMGNKFVQRLIYVRFYMMLLGCKHVNLFVDEQFGGCGAM